MAFAILSTVAAELSTTVMTSFKAQLITTLPPTIGVVGEGALVVSSGLPFWLTTIMQEDPPVVTEELFELPAAW
jgi:hypothetical protein